MIAHIITIGDEILIGQIVDTNSAWIGKELNKIGVDVIQIQSISDDREAILEALHVGKRHADLVLITGGLGPTKDDITKKVLCEYFEDTLIQNKKVLENIEHIFKEYITRPAIQANRDQALVPSQCTVLMNTVGTAPGMWFEKDDTIFVSMPGVPYEMQGLMNTQVVPRLSLHGNLPHIIHRTYMTVGVGESQIAQTIQAWESSLPNYIKLAYLPALGRVRIRMSARGQHKEQLLNSLDLFEAKLFSLIGDIMIPYKDGDSPAAVVFEMLKEQGKTIALAESCTGGKIAAAITEIPGASAVFKGSTVTYATQSKIDVLDVEQDIVEQYSVVSEAVAIQMAIGARKAFKSDLAISTTGNAGPTKGDSDADVGTVYVGVSGDGYAFAKMYTFGNQRERVVGKAVATAFELIQKELEKKEQ